ncbi:hypothetical protein FH5T_16850 [Draconibacterium orientale]|uniref:Uncharacterized protein n=1 Tax=Draconibacterium orientale TaxID=1168034 RepID=A0ABN4D3Q4_9BACT|nr:hypothetical protein FH5T_16850 [Draconibacterium orientale]
MKTVLLIIFVYLYMPSLKSITPSTCGSYYHVFNRGINGQRIFLKKKNYQHFLTLIKKHLTEYVDILAYCRITPKIRWIINFIDNMRRTVTFGLPAAFIFALKQRRNRKFKAAFDPFPTFS